MASKRRPQDAEYINPKYRRQKYRRTISPQFLWVVLLIAAAAFFITFYRLPMFPRKWSWYLLIALGALVLLTGIMSAMVRPKNVPAKIVNIVLALGLAACSVMLPYYTSVVTALFNSVVGNTVRINLIALKDSYKEEHRDVFDGYVPMDDISKASALNGSSFITTIDADRENQSFAIQQLEKELEESPSLIDVASLEEAADELYGGNGDVMIVAQGYESIFSEMEEYASFEQDTRVICSFIRELDSETGKIDVRMTKEPFTIFFGGNDQEGELSIYGRTDVDMLVTVNPLSYQIAIVSLPRDSYIPNPALDHYEDKLTHLGIQGIDNTLDGIGEYLDTEVGNYILVNFTTFRSIIDALDGVDIDNPYRFVYTWDDNYVYEEGNIHLDGQAALYYVRERYNLPNGDFDRNMHQQIVMKAIIQKLASPAVITRFNSLLKAMNGTFLTNISSDSIYSFCQKQLDKNIDWNIVSYHVTGDTGYEVCASAPGQSLSVVYPDPVQIEKVRQILDDVVAGKTVVQEDLTAEND